MRPFPAHSISHLKKEKILQFLPRSVLVALHICVGIGKELCQGIAAGCFQIHRVKLSCGIGCFQYCLALVLCIAAELVRTADNNRRHTGEDVVLEHLQNRISFHLRRAECLFHLLLDVLRRVCDRDDVAFR